MATLTVDALHDPGQGGEPTRVLVFRTSTTHVAVEVTEASADLEISGMISPVPDGGAKVTPRRNAGPRVTPVGADGRFDLGSVRRGPFSIVVRLADRTTLLVTEWVTL